MKQPTTILRPGTRIRTNAALSPPNGMIAPAINLAVRKPGVLATLGQVVPGHGGDVYWAKHVDEDQAFAAPYCFDEFELETLPLERAMGFLMEGWIARRVGWPPSVFAAYVPTQVIEPSKITASTLRFIEAMVGERWTSRLRVTGYFAFLTEDYKWQLGWEPTQEDRGADDWCVVQPEMAMPACLTRR